MPFVRLIEPNKPKKTPAEFTTWLDLERLIMDYVPEAICHIDLEENACTIPGSGVLLEWSSGYKNTIRLEVSISALNGTKEGGAFHNSVEIDPCQHEEGYLSTVVENLICNGIKRVFGAGLEASKAPLEKFLVSKPPA